MGDLPGESFEIVLTYLTRIFNLMLDIPTFQHP